MSRARTGRTRRGTDPRSSPGPPGYPTRSGAPGCPRPAQVRTDHRVQVQVRVVVRLRELRLNAWNACENPFRDGRPLFAATIPTRNASSGTPVISRTCLRSNGLYACVSIACGTYSGSRRPSIAARTATSRSGPPRTARNSHHARGRRLVVDRDPRRGVDLAHPLRVEDPDVHERHDEPAPGVTAEEPFRVLDEVLVAELPPIPGKTGIPSHVIGDPSSP
jgi:hypothetical protein